MEWNSPSVVTRRRVARRGRADRKCTSSWCVLGAVLRVGIIVRTIDLDHGVLHTKRVLASDVIHGCCKSASYTCRLVKGNRPFVVDKISCIHPGLLLCCKGDVWPCLMAVTAEHDAVLDRKVRIVWL